MLVEASARYRRKPRTMKVFKNYVDAFSHLHTAKVKGRKAPHKAVLLLAIIDLVESNVIRCPQIELTDELVKRFREVWRRYLGQSAIFTPDITKPFFHMQHEPFWRLVGAHDVEAMMAAEQRPWRKDKADRKELPRVATRWRRCAPPLLTLRWTTDCLPCCRTRTHGPCCAWCSSTSI